MADLLLELTKALHCPVERNKNLAPLTTLGVGGQAGCFVAPSCVEDFQAVMRLCNRKGCALLILGGGSNIVIADGVIPGVVLSTEHWNAITWLELDSDTGTGNKSLVADVQSGHKLAALLNAAREKNLGGLEFAAGIPGSLGGAIAGNVGAGGRSVGELLLDITTVEPDPNASIKTWHPGEFSWGYRHFAFNSTFSSAHEGTATGRCILSCRLKFEPRSSAEIESEIAHFRSMRAIQPVGSRSAGCTFKNPPKEISGGLSAGQLLDQCGCKGLEIGGAVVSVQHANFILNRGGASARDIFLLTQACQERVFNATGVKLEPEIKFLGFEP